MNDRKNGLTYADSGVDIDAGNRLVDLIKPMVRATARAGADAEIGGFGGLFDLKAAGFKDPVLVAATDGVGTKVKIAIETGLHGGIGIDLVAMSANDLVVPGAEPLFFLDYFACGKLDPAVGAPLGTRYAAACREAACALIRGEPAEMPGLDATGHFDLAGFGVCSLACRLWGCATGAQGAAKSPRPNGCGRAIAASAWWGCAIETRPRRPASASRRRVKPSFISARSARRKTPPVSASADVSIALGRA